MSDGRIEIMIDVDGRKVGVASKELDGLGKSASSASGPLGDAEKGLDGVEGKSKKAGSSIKDMAISFGLVKVASAAFKIVAQSLDAAISRFDIMAKYPKVLSALGFSAEDSEQSIGKLADGIDGLPTKLDTVVASTQQMTSITGDLNKSTDTVLALNNAFLASGASASDASRGTDQYVQMLSSGKVDLQSWKTLQETMPLALQKTAEAMGYTGTSAQRDLYSALQNGEIVFSDFQDQLIELGTGTGILADLAQENSKGIATSWENLRNAVSKNMANILANVDELVQAVTGNTIAENMDSIKHVINSSMAAVGEAIKRTTPFFIAFKDIINETVPVIKFLSPAIHGLVAAYVALQIITKATAEVQKSRAIFEAMSGTITKLTALTNAKTTAELANNGVQAKYIAANMASLKALTAKNIILGLLTGSLSLSTAATLLKAKAVMVLNGALTFLTSPIGLVVVGIGLLVAAGVALVKWFNKASEDGAILTGQTEKLGESVTALDDKLNSSSDAYESNITSIEGTKQANSDLIDEIERLSAIEGKTAEEKKMLAAYVEQLNGSVEGLNISYSEEADLLNESTAYMRERVDLMAEQEKATAAQERLLEISKEQHEVESKLAETNALRQEWNDKLEDGSVKSREHKEAIAGLDEQEKVLQETTKQLAADQTETKEIFTDSMATIAEATANSVESQKINFADLSESQAAAVESMRATWQDYKEAATDMFNTLSDEATITVEEMAANLAENQRVIGEWGDNIAALAARGVDEGLLETLRNAGPEGAGHVRTLVEASDAELEALSTGFAEGGTVATDALAKSLGIENNEVVQSVQHLVTGASQTLAQEIEAADFGSIGKNIAQGLGQGIDEGSAEAETASKGMADKVIDGSKTAFQTHSPSVVFKEIGGNVAQGLALGIGEGSNQVTAAINKMFNQVKMASTTSFQTITAEYKRGVLNIGTALISLGPVTDRAMNNMLQKIQTGAARQRAIMSALPNQLTSPFTALSRLQALTGQAMAGMTSRLSMGAATSRSIMSALPYQMTSQFNGLPGAFSSIGINAMYGLQNGLNAGSGSVMATARSIAYAVASTMQAALKIHSPSRLFRDKIGKMIPLGLAEGMEESAGAAYETIARLSDNLIKRGSVEVALGMNGSKALSAGHQVINNNRNNTSQNSKTITNNSRPTINIEKIENYSDSDIPKILEEAAWIMEGERKRL